VLWVACSSAPEKPPAAIVEDPKAHLFRIGTVWQETSVDEGFLENDPKGVAFFRIGTKVRVELAEDGKTRENIVRDELFRMRDGAEYHCVARGSVSGSAQYLREGYEIRVVLANAPGSLPRQCKESGFPVTAKEISEVSVLFALRSDRLVAIRPAHVHSVLLPIQ